MNIRQNPASASNYTVSRLGNAISEIIIHHAATTDFNGIGRTFQNPARGASAHYGVGRDGAVDQYVAESNIAWHCGNWSHNCRSIGIENVNITGAPNWEIADDTFDTLVELVRDIATRHGLLPLRVGANLFGHKDVSDVATACPFALEGRLQELADRVNNGGGSTSPSPAPSTGKSNEDVATEVIAGQWGNGDDRKARLAAAGYDYAAIQSIVNQRVGSAPAAPRKSNDVVADEVIAGAWGNGSDRQTRLQAAGYDYAAVQAIVNSKVGASAAPAKLSDEQIADQVLAGSWGNGEDRKQRLQSAGYSYTTIQEIVNNKLGIGSTVSNDEIANQVIAGQWGNGDDRKARLAAAGYDYAAVQAIVNRKLGF